MPLPSGIQKVRVFGTYIDAEGIPLKGQILFTPSVNTAGSGVVVLSSSARVTLDVNGAFEVQLPTSTNTGLDPDGWTYQVDELILGHPRRYNIVVSGADGSSVALSTLAPTETVTPTGVYALLVHTHDDRYYTKAQVDALIVGGVAGVTSVNGRAGVVVLTSADVGLGNANNTSDVNKPISTAQQTALDLKSPLASPAFTGTPTAPTAAPGTNTAQLATTAFVTAAVAGGSGAVSSVFGRTGAVTAQSGDYTKAQVGLGSADNTSDVDKPISTATQAALDAKQPLDADLTTIAGLTPTTDNMIQSVAGAWASRTPAQVKAALAIAQADVSGLVSALSGKEPTITAGTTSQYWRGDKSWQTLDKAAVGLSNVDNTTDVGKPISNATQTALDLKAPLASPTFTGTPSLPTGTTGITQTAGDSTTKLATTAFVAGAISTAGGGYQPLDADLTAIAGLSPSNDDFVQRKSGAWTNRTMAQLKTDLALVKADVGLGNVDDTSDVNKPVSSATQTALNLKANLASPTFTGTPAGPTASGGTNTTQLATTAFVTSAISTAAGSYQPLDSDLTTIAGLTATTNNFIVAVSSAWASRTPAQVKTTLALDNLDNTSDANKPVSTAQQTALNLKANLASPTFTGTVSGITAAMVGAPALSLVTTKGDLLVATASATIARQAVGSNGDVLRANSGVTNGVEWANSRQTQTWAFTGTAVVQTGKARWYNRTGRTLTIVGAWVAANTAPATQAILADVNKNGTTIFTTQGNRPTTTVGNGGGISAAPDVTSLADGDYLTVDIDQIGSGTVGADVTVGVVYW